MVMVTLGGQVMFSVVMVVATGLNLLPETWVFPTYLLWTISVFFMATLCIGNLNAIALEPVGHISGMAASVIGAISTVASVGLAVPVGLMFDGTLLPLFLSILMFAATGFGLMLLIPANRMAQPV
jgi:DHA1 family bicyclomycin/chloramphenicol resistance-like MFS transporter